MKTTLIIMAAGIGSRFGTGIKQLAKMNNNGELIIDYSIYDAKEAGFDKVVFIIRKEIEAEFKEVIGDRISKEIEVEYVFQERDDLPEGIQCPDERVKPWGTGQAVLCCKDIVKEPFVIINADDYYGKDAFVTLRQFLLEEYRDGFNTNMAMAGFVLKNTLSDNGVVTRGVCVTDENSMLDKVLETSGIGYVNSVLTSDNPVANEFMTEDTQVSMNFWAGSPVLFEQLEQGFVEFLSGDADQLKGEFLIPIYVDELLRKEQARVKVIKTDDKWLGLTYKEDEAIARQGFKGMIENGKYPEKLW